MSNEVIGTGETYTTIAGWETGRGGTLSEIEKGQLKAENFSESPSITGNITTSNFYMHLTSVVGAEHNGTANAVSSIGNARITYSVQCDISDEWTRLDWLEFICEHTGGETAIIIANVSTCDIYFHHCILHNDGNSTSTVHKGLRNNDSDCKLLCYRNIFYGISGDGFYDITGAAGSSLYYNTFYAMYRNWVCNVANLTGKYNASYDGTSVDIFNSSNPTYDYNWTSDTYDVNLNGSNGSGSEVSTDDMENPTTTWVECNCLITSGSSMIGQGIDESAQGWPGIDESIDNRGTTITGTWDIGASEYVLSGPASISGTGDIEIPFVDIYGNGSISAIPKSVSGTGDIDVNILTINGDGVAGNFAVGILETPSVEMVGVGSLKTYPLNLEIGEWWQVPNSSLSAVYPTNPGGDQAAIMFAWNGAVWDSNRKDLVLPANGGHANYAGNEVYAFNFDPDSENYLTWRRKSFPSVRTDGDAVEEYSDGTPSARHTYCTIHYDSANDKIILCPGGGIWGIAGVFSNRTWEFDATNETPNSAAPDAWERKDDGVETLPGGYPYPTSIWDYENQIVWGYWYRGLVTYEPNETSGNQWTALTDWEGGTSSPGGLNTLFIPNISATFPELSASMFFMIGGGRTKLRELVSPYNWLGTEADFGTSGDNVIEDPTSPGAIWDDVNNEIVSWCGTLSGGIDNRDLYRLNLSTKEWNITSGTGDIPDNPQTNGTFGRFRNMGNGLAVLVNSTTDSVYVVRISKQIVSGTGSLEIPNVTIDGDFVVTSEDISGTGSLEISQVTINGIGQRGIDGLGSLEIPNVTIDGDFVHTSKEVSGTGSLEISQVTIDGIGQRGIDGLGSLEIQTIILSGSGVQIGEGVSGTSSNLEISNVIIDGIGQRGIDGLGSLEIPNVTIDGDFIHTSEGVSGTSSNLEISNVIIDGIGQRGIDGQGVLEIQTIILSGSGIIIESGSVSGTGSINISEVILNGNGIKIGNVSGTSSNLEIPNVTIDGIGQRGIDGLGILEIPNVTINGVGQRGIDGSGTLEISTIEITGNGTLGKIALGDLEISQVTINGVGTLGHIGLGTLEISQVTINGVGQRGIDGSGTLEISQVTIDGDGLKLASLSGTGTLEIPQVTIDGVGIGRVDVSGSGELTLSVMTIDGDGVITLTSATVSGTSESETPEIEIGSGQGTIHNYNPLGGNYCTPNDFFQFYQNKRYDADRNLYKNLQAEGFDIYGTPMMYYVITYDTSYDPLFGEDNNKRIYRKFPIKAVFDLPKEEDAFEKFGLENLDGFEMHVSQIHFECMSKYETSGVNIFPSQFNVGKTNSYDSYTPSVGDIIRSEYNNVYYEILTVHQEEEMFLQGKHAWKFIVRVFKDETLNLTPSTSAAMTDISAVSNTEDILEVNDFITSASNAVLYTCAVGEESSNQSDIDDGWF